MILQENSLPDEKEVNDIKLAVKKEKEQLITIKAENIEKDLSPENIRAISEAKEKGASSWLNVIPLQEYGFVLNKGEFRDAINIRYGNKLRGLLQKCPCGQPFDLTHALNCKKGGFIIIRHNNIRDFEEDLLKKVCADVETEPQLQPLNGKQINGLIGDNAKPDIRARRIWRDGQNGFFDVRITNTNCNSQKHLPVETILRKHENEKKRQYNRRVMDIEHGTFTPLIFSVNGGIGKECSMFHKHIAEKIANKTEEQYGKILSVIRCKLSFIILRSVLMCLRGSRSYGHKTTIEDFEIAFNAAKCDG